jgi:CheY-like chemotaxis protein
VRTVCLKRLGEGLGQGFSVCSRCAPDRPVILIVDDDASIRGTCRDLFEAEGFNVLTAENGLEALTLLHSRSPPSIALLDIEMPVMNGWEFLKVLRESKTIPLFPVVVVSGQNLEPFFDGAPFLPKPVDPDVLLRLVKSLCFPNSNRRQRLDVTLPRPSQPDDGPSIG